MKLKFLSFALVAAALASCSSDDLNVNGTADTQLKDNEVFAYIDSDDDAITRAGWAIQYTSTGTIKQQAMFQEGDVFKMYKSNTWKPQLLKFVSEGTVGNINGGVFAWADGTSKLNDGTDATDMTNREYAVFPVENEAYFQFVDESRSALGYHLDNTIDYGDFTGTASTVKEGFKIYPSIFPLFGFADANNNVKFKHMTSIVRAYIQGLKAGQHKLTLISTDGKQLSGDFESTGFNAADYTSADLPVFDTQVAANAADTELEITFTVEGDGVDQCVFLPVPTGDYDLDKLHLMIDYTPLADAAALKSKIGETAYAGYDENSDSNISDDEYAAYLADYNPEKQAATIDWTLTYKDGDEFIGADMTSIAAATNETVAENYDAVNGTYHLGVGIKLLATKKADIVFSASTLTEINNYMNTLANFGRPVEATITLTDNIDVKDPLNGDYTNESKYLLLPELQNDVKITFVATAAKTFTTNNLTIKDKTTPSSAKKFEIELGTNVTMPQGITYTSKNNFKFTSATANAAGASTINTTGQVDLGVAFSGAVTMTAAGSLTISKDPTQALAVTTASVVIKDAITASVTTTNANVTVNADGKTIAALTMNGGTATITKGTVTTLTVDKDVTALTMTSGKIAKLQGTAANDEFANGGNLAITTSGDASIGAVDDIAAAAAGKTAAVLTFNSTYTGVTADAATAVGGIVPIYTAGQLANVTAATAYKLITNVTIGTGQTWTSKAISGAFDGNGKTITGLDAPLFGALTNAGALLEVKDLTLASVAITSKANAKQAGALAKTITGTWKISGVDAAGTIGTPEGVGTLQTVQLGGLVGVVGDGTTATDVEIYNSHINGTVQGFAKLGGLVGEVNVAKILFSHNSPNRSHLTVLRTVKINTDEVTEYGMAGTFIGSVTGAGNDIQIGKGNEYFSDYISELSFDTSSANLDFAKCKSGDKIFQGMTATGAQARTVNLIGYSTGEVTDGKLNLFANTYYVTATRALANAAGTGKAQMTIANYVNYFVDAE